MFEHRIPADAEKARKKLRGYYELMYGPYDFRTGNFIMKKNFPVRFCSKFYLIRQDAIEAKKRIEKLYPDVIGWACFVVRR